MEWFETIRAIRLEKNAAQRGLYTAAACAKRCGWTQSEWSRIENGEPKKQDGSAPSPTIKKLKCLAIGLDETYSMICKLVEFAGKNEEEDTIELVRRLHPLLTQVDEQRRSAIQDDIVQMAKILIRNAA